MANDDTLNLSFLHQQAEDSEIPTETLNSSENETRDSVSNTFVASLEEATEETKTTEKMIEELSSIISDLKSFNDSSYYVRGLFGEALGFSSEAIEGNIDSLKSYIQNNMLQVMRDFGEYKDNMEKIESMLKSEVGSFSMNQFDSNGHLTLTQEQENSLKDPRIISTVEELYKRNNQLKKEISILDENKINRG